MASDLTTQSATPATLPDATIIHTDQIVSTGAHCSVVKLDLGAAGVSALVTGTVPVSNATLPLPAGASTAAKQDTGNTSVASIDTKVPALGQALAAAAVPVVLTAIQQTALTPPAAITGFAVEAGHLATIDTSTAKIPAQGQALAAASLPVVLPAAQITTLTPPAAIAGFALDATLTGGTQKSKLVDTGGTNVASVSAAGALKVDASGAAVPITDNAGSLTVDAPVGTPAFVRLSDGAAAITTLPVSLAANQSVNVAQINATTPIMKAASTAAAAADAALVVALSPNSAVQVQPSSTWGTATGAANGAVTLTLAAAGAGLFHYLTSLHISRNATAALAGTATLVITSTNITGSPAWSVGNAMTAGGTQNDVVLVFASPIKTTTANTATTIVAPVPGAAVLWRINATYYTGP